MYYYYNGVDLRPINFLNELFQMNILCFLHNRIKVGNPGFFVAFNPANVQVAADFSAIPKLPEQLTVYHISERYNITGVVEK